MRSLPTSLVLALCPWPAFACTMPAGFETPNNFELIEQADLVVLAHVDQAAAEEGAPMPGAVWLEPVEVLKGDSPVGHLIIPGQLDWNGEIIDPIITPLAENHFSAGMGACIRLFYQPGELVLAALRKSPADIDGSRFVYYPFGGPSARSVETVAGKDDFWAEAVRLYLSILRSPAENSQELKGAREELRTRDDIAGHAIANDIDWILTGEMDRPHWDSFNPPAFAVAFLRAPARKEQVALTCSVEEGGPSLMVSRGSIFELVVEEQTFGVGEMDELAVPVATGDDIAQIRSGPIDRADQLLDILSAEHATVGLRRNGELFASADPGDVLYRWAQRCEDILRQRIGP